MGNQELLRWARKLCPSYASALLSNGIFLNLMAVKGGGATRNIVESAGQDIRFIPTGVGNTHIPLACS